jgi:hypothetical protein
VAPGRDGHTVAGWPKTIKDWTLVPGLGAKESGATAVAVDATGAIIVAGFYKNGIAFRRYTAKLNDAGTLLWEDPGLVDGEEIAGLAVSELGDVVTAGSIRTTPLDQDARYDAGTWGYPHDYPYAAERWSDVFTAPLTDPHPDLTNLQSERWRAVLALPGGRFAVIGEREYKDDFIILYASHGLAVRGRVTDWRALDFRGSKIRERRRDGRSAH